MGIKETANNVQTKNESWRGLGGTQEENVVGDDGQMERDEITDDGREERRERVEDDGLGSFLTKMFR